MSTPMTPAQAAQNRNRGAGGRYAAKTHPEAPIDLAGRPDSSHLDANPLSLEMEPRLEKLRELRARLEATPAPAPDADLATTPAPAPDADLATALRLGGARERVELQIKATYTPLWMRQEPLQEPDYAAIAAASGHRLEQVKHSIDHAELDGARERRVYAAAGVCARMRPVPVRQVLTDLQDQGHLELLSVDSGQWEPAAAEMDEHGATIRSATDHATFDADHLAARDDTGAYVISGTAGSVPTAVFRLAH